MIEKMQELQMQIMNDKYKLNNLKMNYNALLQEIRADNLSFHSDW